MQDAQQCQRIMALRRFRDAVGEIERGTKQEDLPDTPAMKKALECMIIVVKGR
jgi:hypothetical protein